MINEKKLTGQPRMESTKKEINPFSEQEKHGAEAQRQAPEFRQDYQGGTIRRAPVAADELKKKRKKA
jgi:hypothetical protein